jgi:hypothetical protein
VTVSKKFAPSTFRRRGTRTARPKKGSWCKPHSLSAEDLARINQPALIVSSEDSTRCPAAYQ